MRSWHRRTFNALSVVVIATGILYFWMKDMLVTDDPLAVVNHPLQPLTLDLHLLSAPALLVIFGVVFNAHVAAKLVGRAPLRRSGLASLITFAAMSLTGYLLPVIVNERAHIVIRWLHIGSGLVFATSYGIHLASGLALWRRVEVRPRSSSA